MPKPLARPWTKVGLADAEIAVQGERRVWGGSAAQPGRDGAGLVRRSGDGRRGAIGIDTALMLSKR